MEWYSIGSVTFPASWGGILGALALGSLYTFLRRDKAVSDWYGNALFIFIVAWKLSVVLFDFPIVIRNPITILYFHGGLKGYGIGIAAALVYTFLWWRKNGKAHQLVEAWLFTVLAYELGFALLNHGAPILLAAQAAVNILLLYMFHKNSKGAWRFQLLVLFTGWQAIIYSLQSNILSAPMITYAALAVFFGYILSYRRTDL